MVERRQFIRISKSVEVTYQILKQFLRSGTRSVDISLGGIRLPTLQRLNPGIVLKLEIRFIEINDHIEATGEVVWQNERKAGEFPFETGIKFINISPSDEKTLNNMIEKFEERGSSNIRPLD